MLKSLLGSFPSRKAAPVSPPASPVAQRPLPPATPVPQSSEAFFDHLMQRFFVHLAEFQPDNFDYERFNVEPGTPVGANTHASLAWFHLLRRHIDDLRRVHDLLEDEASSQLYEDLILYRLLLHPHMRLPTNNAQHWAMRQQASNYRRDAVRLEGIPQALFRYEIEFQNEQIAFLGGDGNVAWTFLLKQYYFQRGGAVVQVSPGDVVIDAGACFGDTALGFAAAAGPQGRVFAFDIMPAHLQIIQANLALNPLLAARIEAVEAALSDGNSQTLYIHGKGPGARISDQPSDQQVAVTSIDEFAARKNLPRVDFIKMDIEGAEPGALRGAQQTIQRYKPKLAISLYHNATDIFDLPLLIDSMGVDYRYYLDHYTIHTEETVLYAIPRK